MDNNSGKMYGVVNGVHQCQQERTSELDDRIYERLWPSTPLQPQYSMRPVSTKYALMPIVDQREKATVPIGNYPVYNTKQVFNPGTAQAPWSGFSTNVNTESKLRNQFFALQKCEQSEFVPSSSSELYVPYNPKQTMNGDQPFPDLFNKPEFDPFNPNTLDLGGKILNNSTRVQLLDACSSDSRNN